MVSAFERGLFASLNAGAISCDGMADVAADNNPDSCSTSSFLYSDY